MQVHHGRRIRCLVSSYKFIVAFHTIDEDTQSFIACFGLPVSSPESRESKAALTLRWMRGEAEVDFYLLGGDCCIKSRIRGGADGGQVGWEGYQC